MTNKKNLFLFLFLALSSSIPLFVLFYKSLSAVSRRAGLLTTVCSVGILLPGIILLFQYGKHLGKVAKCFVATAVGIAIVFTSMSGDTIPVTTDLDISLTYSDGSRSDHVSSTPSIAWGRSFHGYFLHPRIDSVRVPETLVVDFSTRPSLVKIWVAKPLEALLLPNGMPTPSDGIGLEISALDSKGQAAQTKLLYVSQAEFLKHRWFSEVIFTPDGISDLTVKVTAGPAGSSTTAYDTTIVALEVQRIQGIRAYLFAIGKALLSGLAAAVIAMALLRYREPKSSILAPQLRQRPVNFLLEYLFPLSFFSSIVLLIVYWSASQTEFVYYWDYRNYWEKTEQLYELMKSGAWDQFAAVIRASYSSDYSMLPAILPALVSLPFRYPSRLVYVLTITAVYVVPAFLMVAYLAARLVGRGAVRSSSYRGYYWVLSALATLFGFPLFLSVALNLMPDIGGVILVIGATLLAAKLTRMVAVPDGNTSSSPPPALVRASLGFGVLLSLMFLFRRWYIFTAVGIVLAGMLIVIFEILQNKRHRRAIMVRTVVAIILIGVAVLSLLAWVMFDWARNLGARDYANLYSSYASSLAQDLNLFISKFGLVAPSLVLAFVFLAPALKLDQRLLFILVSSSTIGCVLFLRVQSPSLQHFYLLMPLLGAGLAGVSQSLSRRHGLSASVVFGAILLLGGASATANYVQIGWLGTAFPNFKAWMPKQQNGMNELKRMGEWLLSPDIRSSKFCIIASSTLINDSIVQELWQIAPSVPKHSLDGRMVWLGAFVDSRDGPPREAIKQCEIALVGSPLQTHLRDGEQYSLQILQEDLINNTGIGIAYERLPMIFAVDEHTKVFVFRRTRELTNEEYQDIVTRFHRKKAAQAALKRL